MPTISIGCINWNCRNDPTNLSFRVYTHPILYERYNVGCISTNKLKNQFLIQKVRLKTDFRDKPTAPKVN